MFYTSICLEVHTVYEGLYIAIYSDGFSELWPFEKYLT